MCPTLSVTLPPQPYFAAHSMPNQDPQDRPYEDDNLYAGLQNNPFVSARPWKYFANYVRYKTAVGTFYVVLLLAAGWLFYKALVLPEHSFFSEVSIVLSAGIAPSLLLPWGFACAALDLEITVGVLVLCAILCGIAAYFREGPMASLLIEASG